MASVEPITFRGQTFADDDAYFAHLIDALGFPDILDAFERDWVLSDGLRLHLDVHTHHKDAPTVVFVPGTSVYGACYAEILFEIGRAGYNIVSLDPRGHGRSEGRRGDYTIGEIMRDVRTVVDYARSRFNARVSLMGSSQGGIVAFYLAAEGIDVDSVICQNFADLTWSETAELSRYPALARVFKPVVSGLGAVVPGVRVPVASYLDLKGIRIKYFENLHRFIHDDPFTVTHISLRAARSLTTARLARRVEEIDVPILVFQGKRDTVFPVEYTRHLYDRLTCRKAMHLYDHLNHAIMVEDVDVIKGDLIAWLDETYRG